MQYHVILNRVITALDCITNDNYTNINTDNNTYTTADNTNTYSNFDTNARDM